VQGATPGNATETRPLRPDAGGRGQTVDDGRRPDETGVPGGERKGVMSPTVEPPNREDGSRLKRKEGYGPLVPNSIN